MSHMTSANFISCFDVHNPYTQARIYARDTGGPGPRAADFQGRHIKKNRDRSMVRGGKKAVHEREF
jgi:hypothetical protein